MLRAVIRRPVAVAMLYLAAALLGIAAWRNIAVELLPDAELPRLRVEAAWQGASPETMEAFVTSPLEAAVQQVRGVERVTSTSRQQNGEGTAELDVEFARGTDMDFARLDLIERFAAIEDELPPRAERRTVQAYVPDELASQEMPFLVYTVTGPYTVDALREHANAFVVPAVQQVEGVGAAAVYGGRARLLEIQLDEAALAAHRLTPLQVQRAVGALEVVREAGTVVDDGIRRSLAIRQRAGSADDVRNAVLLADRGRVVRVRDVGTVHDTHEEPQQHYRIDGQPAVQLVVTREAATNAIRVADSVRATIAGLDGGLPPGLRLILDRDESRAIRAQLADLRSRSVLSGLVIVAVLLAFLGSVRSVVIVCATIAFSVLIAVNLMYWAGYSLNVLTLMGLAMGFGTMADTAIVVLENIYRRWRGGDAPADAAERGTREVLLAIVAGTATALVVFIPFVYLQGELRLYYVPLAVVTALTQAASLFVAFTLIPALGARLLGARGGAAPRPNGAAGATPDHVPRYVRAYERVLRATLRMPWATAFVAVALVAGSYWLFDRGVARGLVWRNWGDQRSSLTVQISQSRGEELARTDEIARVFEDRARPLPYVDRIVTNVSPQGATVRLTFPDSVELTDAPAALKEELTVLGYGFGGAEVRVTGYGPSFGGGGAAPPNYAIEVFGYNYETVRAIADGLKERLEGFSRVRAVNVNATGRFGDRERATEVVLDVDRRRLALHDLTVEDVVRQVRAAVRGAGVGAAQGGLLVVGGEERRFSVKLAGSASFDVLALEALALPTRAGTTVRLADVATVRERDVLGVVQREDQQYRRVVAYEFRGPAKLGTRTRDAVVEATALPDGYSLRTGDDWAWGDDEAAQLYGVLALSLVLVYMVTAALFESFRQPAAVLLTVPMALVGVFVTFEVTKASFTREAVIGVIMMGGIVVNNAILLVDRVNQLRRGGGLPLADAVVGGALQRVRPILMTSVSTVLGLLPLVLFSDYADENIWNALGYALIGGLTSSTILVLTVTPAIYVLLERGAERRRVGAAAPAPAPEAVAAAG